MLKDEGVIVESVPNEFDPWETVFVFTPNRSPGDGLAYSMEFAVYRPFGAMPDAEGDYTVKMFEIFNWNMSGDDTTDLEQACPQIRGTVEEDGGRFLHVYFGNAKSRDAEPDGYLSMGKSGIRWMAWALERVIDRSREIMDGSAWTNKLSPEDGGPDGWQPITIGLKEGKTEP